MHRTGTSKSILECLKAGLRVSAITLGMACLSAAGAMAQFDPRLPQPIEPIGGAVIVTGYGAVSLTALRRFVERAGDGASHIVIVRTRLAEPGVESSDAAELATWKVAGATSIAFVRASTVEDANAPDLANTIREATGVWFDEDDSERIAGLLVGTPFERAIDAVIERGGVVGAGGEAARSFTRVMIRNDGSLSRGFDFIPGAVIDTWPDDAVRARRLRSVLSTQASRVGVGVGVDASVIFEGRSLSAIGPGRATSYLATSSRLPWRSDRIPPAPGTDFIALSRAAMARSQPPFPADDPPAPVLPNGMLMLAGGGALPDGLLSRFVEQAGGAEARIVFIPCSPETAIAEEPEMIASLRALGAGNVTWMHTTVRARARTDAVFLTPLETATGIWIGGGRQWNLVDSYLNTTAHRLMAEVLDRGGVIGGSSAGASIQASYLVRGDPQGNANIIAEGYERGFGFISGIAVDQHFSDRGRQRDMVLLKRTYPQLLGVGLDEGTAIIIAGTVAEVVTRPGDRHVYFYDGDDGHSPPHRFENGARYDLVRRERVDTAR